MPCASSSSMLAFDKFRIDRRRRRLFVENTTLPLDSRALDVLEFLIDNRERVVSREEIVAHVWRGRIVGENNLTVQLSAVRRLLAAHDAADLIVTVVGRGYRFAGDATDYQTPSIRVPLADVPAIEHAILGHPPFPRRRSHLAVFPAAAARLAGLRGHPRNAREIESP